MIKILIVEDEKPISDLLKLGGLVSELEDAFNKKVDVLTTQMLSTDFLNRIHCVEILIFSVFSYT